MRSRVTSNCLPTSSSVWSVLISMPKRMRRTLASRGVSESSTSLTTSRMEPCRAHSDGDKVPEIGRAHVRTPVTNAQLVCRLLLEKKKHYSTDKDTRKHN